MIRLCVIYVCASYVCENSCGYECLRRVGNAVRVDLCVTGLCTFVRVRVSVRAGARNRELETDGNRAKSEDTREKEESKHAHEIKRE